MIKSCQYCSLQFTITQDDQSFYKRFDVPTPTLCPDCREQRRLSYRNERSFYNRKCDATGKDVISIYPQDFPGKVYSYDFWWSDSYDPLTIKDLPDFDFTKPFFPQYLELATATPRPCIVNMNSENSLYTNHSAYNKNCYMCMNTGYCEDLLYCSNYCLYSKDCADCLAIKKCERCYFCTNTENSQFCSYLYQCGGMIDSHFCYDCQGCQSCVNCYNLRHKKFCIFNKQFSKDEYQKKLKELTPTDWNASMEAFSNWKNLIFEKAFHKDLFIEKCQNCTGDHVANSKNTRDSFYVFDMQDCAYCYDAGEMKDCYDVVEPFKGELEYETHACNINYRILFCSKCYENNNMTYCQYCWHCSNCFGCFGLRDKKYCVFNKQYSKEEYEKLVPKFIVHMKETKEWGEFFPMEHSPFKYEETAANDYYPRQPRHQPITQKHGGTSSSQAASGHDSVPLTSGHRPPLTNVRTLSGHATSSPGAPAQILTCPLSARKFKIIDTELAFYKAMNLPVPSIHPDERHRLRMNLRDPRRMRESTCVKCKSPIKTAAHPSFQNILCRKCYLEEVY